MIRRILGLVLLLSCGCASHKYDVLPTPRPEPIFVDPTPVPTPHPVPPVKPTPTPAPAPIGKALPAELFHSFVVNQTTYNEVVTAIGVGNHPTRKPYRDPVGNEYRYYLVQCATGVRDAVLTFKAGVLTDKDVCY